jgi:hypothetical protein
MPSGQDSNGLNRSRAEFLEHGLRFINLVWLDEPGAQSLSKAPNGIHGRFGDTNAIAIALGHVHIVVALTSHCRTPEPHEHLAIPSPFPIQDGNIRRGGSPVARPAFAPCPAVEPHCHALVYGDADTDVEHVSQPIEASIFALRDPALESVLRFGEVPGVLSGVAEFEEMIVVQHMSMLCEDRSSINRRGSANAYATLAARETSL